MRLSRGAARGAYRARTEQKLLRCRNLALSSRNVLAVDLAVESPNRGQERGWGSCRPMSGPSRRAIVARGQLAIGKEKAPQKRGYSQHGNVLTETSNPT